MKWRKIAVAAVLLAVPMLAFSQTVTQDGQRIDPSRGSPGQGVVVGGIYRADTTFRSLTLNDDGSVATSEAVPFFDQFGVAQDVIGPRTLNVAAADSSLPIDSHAWRITGMYIKATPRSGVAANLTRLAFQVRAHLNGSSDSNSVYVWYPVPSAMSLGGNSVAGPDTTMTMGHLTTGSASVLWSGEFTVVVSLNRNAPASAAAAVAFSYPNGIYVPFTNFFGTTFWAPYMSVRVRNLAGNNVDIRVTLVGTAL